MLEQQTTETSLPSWMVELNEPQRKAVEYTGGPLLVLAGAGSGKTRVITYRIAHLIEVRGASPWNILAVTFTNKAAQEMKERVASLLGERADAAMLSTFHSLCARILRRDVGAMGISPDFSIYDEDDSMSLIGTVKAAVAPNCSLKPQRIRARISSAKSEMMTPEDMAETIGREYSEALDVAKIYKGYEEGLRVS